MVGQGEHLKVVDNVAVWVLHGRAEAETLRGVVSADTCIKEGDQPVAHLKYLGLGDDDVVFEIIELLYKVVHRSVAEACTRG